MPDVFVGVGSNADPVRALRTAVAELTKRFGAVRCSSVYRSAAVGGPADDYLNMVLSLATDHGADFVRAELQAIEALAGRTRTDRAVVTLDLDLLLYGACVDALGRLPRPGLRTTPFVLGPLAEVAPAVADPLTGERYGLLWRRMDSAMLDNLGALDALS